MMFFVVETKIFIFAPTKLQNNEKTDYNASDSGDGSAGGFTG